MNDHRHRHRHLVRPPRGERSRPPPWSSGCAWLELDLLRADLYRLLDELARTTPERYGDIVHEYERAWEAFKDQTGRRVGRP